MFAIREFGPNWEYEAISLRARFHCGFLEEYYNYTNSDLKPITEQLRIKKKKKKKMEITTTAILDIIIQKKKLIHKTYFFVDNRGQSS